VIFAVMPNKIIFGFVAAAIALAAWILVSGTPGLAADADVVVYKSPTCGCCAAWADHMRENGFTVQVVDVADPGELAATKAEHGVPADLGSCHTALVNDYVIEGHVPAAAVRQLLEEAPPVHGLAVPGMPMGSPGMEGPHADRYDIIAFRRSGAREVFATVDPAHGPEPMAPASAPTVDSSRDSAGR
jgi:hypothetical protein